MNGSPRSEPGATTPRATSTRGRAQGPGPDWLAQACADVERDPASVHRAFALAGRRVGRAPRDPAHDPTGVVRGTLDDDARAALVVTLAEAVGTGADVATVLTELYHRGDAAERRGVLRGLDALVRRGSLAYPENQDSGGDDASGAEALAAAGRALAEDALRTNDQSLVAAAVGPFGSRFLDQHTWRHAVLKLVFMGVSLDAVHDLPARADDELARMARDYAAERRAAGREVPADVGRLVPAARPSTTPSTPE